MHLLPFKSVKDSEICLYLPLLEPPLYLKNEMTPALFTEQTNLFLFLAEFTLAIPPGPALHPLLNRPAPHS